LYPAVLATDIGQQSLGHKRVYNSEKETDYRRQKATKESCERSAKISNMVMYGQAWENEVATEGWAAEIRNN